MNLQPVIFAPWLRPLAHGNNLDEWLFGGIFLLLVVVFLYFYLSSPDTGEGDPDSENNP